MPGFVGIGRDSKYVEQVRSARPVLPRITTATVAGTNLGFAA